MSEPIQRTLTIPAEHAGQRLDQVLAELLSDFSRTRIKEWIEAGQVLVDGEKLRPKDKVLGGEQVRVTAVVEDTAGVEAEQIELDVVHQDRHIFVLNKPAGLVVHPGAGNAAGTLQNALLHLDPKLAQVPRAGIVHRLDKDTSGLMVVARVKSNANTMRYAPE
jgi:23S rRNA pseudouridine1911/1915/1917 synthase